MKPRASTRNVGNVRGPMRQAARDLRSRVISHRSKSRRDLRNRNARCDRKQSAPVMNAVNARQATKRTNASRVVNVRRIA